jgi:hypothetical protein
VVELSGLLQDVLRAMDDADCKLSIEAADEGIVMPAANAMRTGEDALKLTCEAFGLDFDQVVTMAMSRSERTTDLTLTILGENPCPKHRELYAGLHTAGMVTGIRLGLLLAEEIKRREDLAS